MKISTIITYYRGINYIAEALNSIKLNINYSDKQIKHELIIVDDSVDKNTHLFLLKVINDLNLYNYTDLKIIKNKKNIGVVNSRKIGLENITGDVFHILDQDDYYSEKTYNYLIKNFFQKDFQILVLNGYKIFNKNNKIKKSLFKSFLKTYKKIEKKINSTNNYFQGGNQIITPGMCFFNVSMLQDIKKIYNIMLRKECFIGLDDYWLNILLVKYNFKFEYIPRTFFYYRLHGFNQRKMIGDEKRYKRFIESVKYMYKEKLIDINEYSQSINRINFLRESKKNFSKALIKYPFIAFKYIKSIYL